MLASTAFALGAAPALATGILLLATARTWRSSRLLVETLGCACLFVMTVAALSPLPPVIVRGLLPLVAVTAAWSACAHAEWRWAPDRGQRGYGWAVPAAAGRAVPLAFATCLSVAPFAWPSLGS